MLLDTGLLGLCSGITVTLNDRRDDKSGFGVYEDIMQWYNMAGPDIASSPFSKFIYDFPGNISSSQHLFKQIAPASHGPADPVFVCLIIIYHITLAYNPCSLKYLTAINGLHDRLIHGHASVTGMHHQWCSWGQCGYRVFQHPTLSHAGTLFIQNHRVAFSAASGMKRMAPLLTAPVTPSSARALQIKRPGNPQQPTSSGWQ